MTHWKTHKLKPQRYSAEQQAWKALFWDISRGILFYAHKYVSSWPKWLNTRFLKRQVQQRQGSSMGQLWKNNIIVTWRQNCQRWLEVFLHLNTHSSYDLGGRMSSDNMSQSRRISCYAKSHGMRHIISLHAHAQNKEVLACRCNRGAPCHVGWQVCRCGRQTSHHTDWIPKDQERPLGMPKMQWVTNEACTQSQ